MVGRLRESVMGRSFLIGFATKRRIGASLNLSRRLCGSGTVEMNPSGQSCLILQAFTHSFDPTTAVLFLFVYSASKAAVTELCVKGCGWLRVTRYALRGAHRLKSVQRPAKANDTIITPMQLRDGRGVDASPSIFGCGVKGEA